MRCVIVTGMSGAGKSTALKMLEDAGYFCVDNLPTSLLVKFADWVVTSNQENLHNIALGVDIRSGKNIDNLGEILDTMKGKGLAYEILFLDSSDEVLVKRYKETRRTHPVSGSDRVENGISEEKKNCLF